MSVSKARVNAGPLFSVVATTPKSEKIIRLGPFETLAVLYSYAQVKLFPRQNKDHTFEDWVINRFGNRLYEIFFKTYTEKVWGIPCNEISADWAAQRIKDLSLKEAIKNALERIAAAGKASGILAVTDEPTQRYIEYGAQFVAVGADVFLLTQSARALAAKWKAV